MARFDPSDPQQFLVYNAEGASRLHSTSRRFANIAEAEAYAFDIMHAEGAPLDLLRGVHRTRTVYSYYRCSSRTISLSSSSHLSAYTLLHELAHVLTDRTLPAHGTAFCSTLLGLVRRHLGFHAYGALKAAFDRKNVDYKVLALTT